MGDFKKQFLEWLKEVCPMGKIEDYCQFLKDDSKGIEVVIYTDENEYHIEASKFYLGAILRSREAEAGEDWIREKDLPDGGFSKKTW